VKLVTWLEPDGSIQLDETGRNAGIPRRQRRTRPRADLARSAEPRRPPPVTRVSPVHAGRRRGNSSCGEFALRDASISAEDRRTKPAAKVLLAPLSIKVDRRQPGSRQAGECGARHQNQ
jgi:hypothetical protein